MSLEKHFSDLNLQATLRVDALYYHFALEIFRDVQLAQRRYRRKISSIFSQFEIDIPFTPDEYKTEIDNTEELVKMERALGAEYGKILQRLATIHLLCAASLEAHINIRSREFLYGQVNEQFERLSFEAKWLFFPTFIGKKCFDPGKQPYQDFSTLVKYRNALAHFKGKAQIWSGSTNSPFFEKIGLTLEDASASIGTVAKMVSELASVIGEHSPSWLDEKQMDYFEIKSE